jgi:predicted RNA-binding Zn ribbon-like protein
MKFSFHRGSLALDFVGTVGQRASLAPEERLTDGQALGTWLREARLAAPVRVSDAELVQAKELREVIHQLGAQRLEAKPLGRPLLARLNEAATWAAEGAPQLDAAGNRRFSTGSPLRFSLGRIAEDAIDRLSSDEDELTRCELPGCGALLLSRSRGDRRRWCSMDSCGNRAKVAAFRERQRREANRRRRVPRT